MCTEEGHVKTEAEISDTATSQKKKKNAKDCQQPLEARREVEQIFP